ncbi:MAG: hypothetical protein GYA51_03720, partial [Candidatus Methanofastidiosa archaeon]|nr:hypothetical protein [Candidatus Methanofastidiosa archaeon]
MTHKNDYTFTEELAEKGLEAVPELLRVLINNAMQVEKTKYLQAAIRKYAQLAPHLSAWMEENLAEG